MGLCYQLPEIFQTNPEKFWSTRKPRIIIIAPDKALFFIEKYWYFSYFSTKTYIV